MRLKVVTLKAWVCAAVLLAVPAARAQTPGTLVPVKIGILNDMSGIYSDLTGHGSVTAAQMAIEDFKAKENGLDVTIVEGDHQNKPDIGAAIARQWYDKEGVDAIFDVPASSVALAVTQITHDRNKVFVASGSGTADLTGPACNANFVHWTYDTYALAKVTGGAMVQRGGDSWYFLTADYAFGAALQRDAAATIVKMGGTVLGNVKTPFPNPDFSSALLQAQSSKAKIIGLANAGADTINAIKQAAEFGIAEGGQKLAALLIYAADVHALTPKVAQGLVLTEAFYWDQNDQTRAFSARFAALNEGRKPSSGHAGVYGAVLHYLKAVAALKSAKDGAAVVAKMKDIPTDDPVFGKGRVRIDGRHIHNMYLFEVKTPAESTGPWDLYKTLATVPGDEAFRPLSEGGCPLVK